MDQLKTYTPPEGMWRLCDSINWRTYNFNEVLKHIDDFSYSEETEDEVFRVLCDALNRLQNYSGGNARTLAHCYYAIESDRMVSLNLGLDGVNFVVSIDMYVTNAKNIQSGYIRHVGIVERRNVVPSNNPQPSSERKHDSQT